MISLSPRLPWRPAWPALACASLLLPVFVLIHFSAYWLRFEGQISDTTWHQFSSTVLVAVTIKVVVFSLFRIYQGWSRYVTFHDLAMLVKAVTVLPSYEQLIQGTVDLRPREVSIEDLLRREPVRLDTSRLHHWPDDQVVLVTGSAGSIGSEICRQLLQFSPQRLIAVDRSETSQFFLEQELAREHPQASFAICLADLNDAPRMESLFRRYRPTIVFHAAAYKHVPLMEAHPGEAVKNITRATCRLADLSETHGVTSFVMISTDKAVNPSSVMGTCKRLAELNIQARAAKSRCQFVTVRFGNVLDSTGSVIPVFREQIARGGPVTVTHPEMERFFMTIPEASQLVIQAGAMGRGGEIFVLDMGEPVRIEALARDLIRLSGLRVGEDIAIEYTGIRPGEKLYEELHSPGELHLPTGHPKIRVATCESTDPAVLEGALEYLQQIADETPDLNIEMLSHLAAEYERKPATSGTGTRQYLPRVPPRDNLLCGLP